MFISEELYAKLSKNGYPHKNDIMITAVGTLGKTYVVTNNDEFYYKDASVICLQNIFDINSQYIALLFNTYFMENQIKALSFGTTVGTITIEKANKYLVPLPPIAEQYRIVNKINKLLVLLNN